MLDPCSQEGSLGASPRAVLCISYLYTLPVSTQKAAEHPPAGPSTFTSSPFGYEVSSARGSLVEDLGPEQRIEQWWGFREVIVHQWINSHMGS